jgi:hypothetical protein
MTMIPDPVRAEVLREEVLRLRDEPPTMHRKAGVDDHDWYVATQNFAAGFITCIRDVLDHAVQLDTVPDDLSEIDRN